MIKKNHTRFFFFVTVVDVSYHHQSVFIDHLVKIGKKIRGKKEKNPEHIFFSNHLRDSSREAREKKRTLGDLIKKGNSFVCHRKIRRDSDFFRRNSFFLTWKKSTWNNWNFDDIIEVKETPKPWHFRRRLALFLFFLLPTR